MTLARTLAGFALVAAGSLVWACASFTGDAPTAGATSAADGGSYVASCADLVPSPTAVKFGEARVARDGGAASSVAFDVLVRNAGTVARALSAEASGPFRVAEAGPMGLAPGEARPVRVTFSPTAKGSATGELKLTTADGCSAIVPLEGSGTDSDYAVTPAALTLDVLCGKTAQAAIQIDSAPGVTGTYGARIEGPFGVTASGPLVSGGKVEVGITLTTPLPQPRLTVSGVLSLTLPNEADARKIPVTASSRGADIVFASESGAFVARNIGNDVAHVVFKASDGAISIMPAKALIPPLGSVVLRFLGPSIAWDLRAEQDPAYPSGAVCHTDVFQFEATGGSSNGEPSSG